MRQNIGVDAAGSRAMRSDLATSSYAQERNACWGHSQEAAVKDLSSSTCSDEGILVNLALLPPKTLVTEDGLALAERTGRIGRQADFRLRPYLR